MRAYDLKLNLEINRNAINWEQLLAATSHESTATALQNVHQRAKELLLQKAGLLLAALRDKQFPKRSREAQEKFIADSLAAEGRVSIRRSRDTVQATRSALRKQGKIIRREFYIECSCGYQSPALRDACPECRAPVSHFDFHQA